MSNELRVGLRLLDDILVDQGGLSTAVHESQSTEGTRSPYCSSSTSSGEPLCDRGAVFSPTQECSRR